MNDFAAFVETALRADSMLHARFLAVWTGRSLRHAQRIVRATLSSPSF